MYTLKIHKRRIYLVLIYLILILSFTDAFFTDIGIRYFSVEEGNPFAKLLYDYNILVFYGYKIILPLILISIYQFAKNSKWVNTGIIICLGLYIFINIYHMYWLFLVL